MTETALDIRSVASRYDTVLAALAAGVVIHGPDTAILEANDRARAMLGITDLSGRLATDPQWQFFEADFTPMGLERFPVVQVIETGRPVANLVMVARPPQGPDLMVEVNALPRYDEAGELIEVAVTFIDVTSREIQRNDAEELARRLHRMAVTDELTGLANRRGIVAKADRAIAAAAHDGQPLCFLLIDLDRFKAVNDTRGHAAGDTLLTAIAGRISGALRRQDNVGRFGGEEFLAVLPGANHASALAVAERIRAAVESAGQHVGVTASIGIAQYEVGEATDSLVRRADAAMYSAKGAGRNRVRD